MKPLFFIFLSLLYVQQCEAQKAVVANIPMNIVYLHSQNKIDFVVENRSCKDFILTTDNGKLESTNDSFSYIYTPEKRGRAQITLTSKKGTKSYTKTFLFKTKELPDIITRLGGSVGGGDIAKSFFCNQKRIVGNIDGFDGGPQFETTKFTVNILRNDTALFVKKYFGAYFPEELKKIFQNLNTKDRVLFFDISCKVKFGGIVKLEPIYFTITE